MHDWEGHQTPYRQITEKLGPSPGEFGDQAGSPPHVFQLTLIQHFPNRPHYPSDSRASAHQVKQEVVGGYIWQHDEASAARVGPASQTDVQR